MRAFAPWATAKTTAAAIGGVAGAAIVTGAIDSFPIGVGSRVALAAAAFVVSAMLSAWCMSAKTGSSLVLRALGAGALLAFVVGGVQMPTALILSLPRGLLPLTAIIQSWIVALFLAAIVGAPMGAAASLGFLPLFFRAHEEAQRPTHASREAVLRRGGPWLGAVALFVAGLATWMHSGSVAPWIAAGMTCLAGAAALFASLVSTHLRRRWLRAVRAGDVPGWRVVPASEITAPTSLLPFERLPWTEVPEETLVRLADRREVSYRDAAVPREDEPVALVRAAQ